MAKKSRPTIAVRRPPSVNAAALDRFIQGDDPEPPTVAHESPQTAVSVHEHPQTAVSVHPPSVGKTSANVLKRSQASKDVSHEAQPRGIVTRLRVGDRRRRTIYLPPELDQRLETWCAEQGREVSHAIAEAVRKLLAGKRSG